MTPHVKPLSLIATCSLALGLVAAGHAQTPTAPVQKPLSIKVGANFPTESSARSNEGTTTLSAGLDYAFVKTAEASPTLPSIYLDYAGGNKNGGHVNTYGLGVAVRQYTNGAIGSGGSTTAPYIGAGIGAYVVDVRNGSGGGGSSTKTNLGGKVFAGVEFGGGVFVEANYQLIGSNKGVNPSGIGAQLGYRF